MTSDGTYNYTYDNEGNLLTATNIATGAITTYTWDYHNRLTEAETKTASGTVTMDETFTYDVHDRLIEQNVNGVQTWTTYVDQSLPTVGRMADNVYATFNSSGSLTSRYLSGPALDQVLAGDDSSGNVSWYLTDDQGSVRDVVDASGNVLDAINYDAYGNITSETNTGVNDPFKYNGMVWDNALSKYLDNARVYDPVDGRFISQDPLSFAAGQTNLYVYVGNGPTDGTDITGLVEFTSGFPQATGIQARPDSEFQAAVWAMGQQLYENDQQLKAAGANEFQRFAGMFALDQPLTPLIFTAAGSFVVGPSNGYPIPQTRGRALTQRPSAFGGWMGACPLPNTGARSYLAGRGIAPEKLDSFVESGVDGSWQLRQVRQGGSFNRYSSTGQGTGNFLTDVRFEGDGASQMAVDAFHLMPEYNNATYRQDVTALRPTWVLQSAVTGSNTNGFNQFIPLEPSAWQFGTGIPTNGLPSGVQGPLPQLKISH